MKLYVISADTYEDSWGSMISIFGVCDSLESAENAIKELSKENDYLYEINEMTLNEINEISLGGYFE